MKCPRIGLVGGRRARQGLGPFVARALRLAGADVPCFTTSRSETLSEARGQLSDYAGVEARGYVELVDLIDSEEIDALAILTPMEFHGDCLDIALDRGLHVICDKPLVWGGDNPVLRARSIAEAFVHRGLGLWEICQWPETLSTFLRLYPDARSEPTRKFYMNLSPISAGQRMLADSLSHPLSLLQAWLPGSDPRLERINFEMDTDKGRPSVLINFEYRIRENQVNASVLLVQGARQPRDVGFAFNEHYARRLVKMPKYSMFLCDENRQIAMPDPLVSLLGRFVDELRDVLSGASPPKMDAILERMDMIQALDRAFSKKVSNRRSQEG